MKYQILVDSASDLTDDYIKDENIDFKVVPLTIRTGEQEFVDDNTLDTAKMLEQMHANKKSTSACPSPESFLENFSNAQYTFIVTITSKLSGCYNSAVVAKNSYEKSENVCVIDSKAVSGTEILIVDRLKQLIEEGKEFEEICNEIQKFRDERELFFKLHKFDNLVNNGRMSKFSYLLANTLSIKPVCVANDGEIKVAKKVIGIKNAFSKMITMIGEKIKDFSKRVLIITHCFAEKEANDIKDSIEKKYNFKEIRVKPMRGLCSFYALEKGIIVCH